ncbi:MAG: type IV pilus twitching motility protein PilT [Candidatus Omnitrophota bacterium]
MRHTMRDLLKVLSDRGASDLHLSANARIVIRVDENLVPYGEDPLTAEEAKRLTYELLSKDQAAKFERDYELDMAYELADVARYRVNAFIERGHVSCSVRVIPFRIMDFRECGLPVDVVTSLCRVPKGLVLITGATGSGKSTSLASMVDYINEQRACHIITIEDPIEFVHKNKKALIHQREVYSDTHSFGDALKHILRQDPDVILIGEMRDLETIESALIIAETGHLVFATLHTSDCSQTINRVIDVFPAYQQRQIRTQLSFVLSGILSQQLIPKASGSGRVLATEIMIANAAIRSLIREMKVHQIYSTIQTSQREGMKTMNQALFELYQKKAISYDDAVLRTTDLEGLKRLFVKS